MQLHYLLVIVESDVKVMSSTVAITAFLNQTEQNSSRNESEFFFKYRTESEPKFKKNLFRTSLETGGMRRGGYGGERRERAGKNARKYNVSGVMGDAPESSCHTF